MNQKVRCEKHTGLYGKGPFVRMRGDWLTESTFSFVVG